MFAGENFALSVVCDRPNVDRPLEQEQPFRVLSSYATICAGKGRINVD